MPKDSVATQGIYRFASEQANTVPTEEESIFVLTSSQLHEIIREATKPLNSRIQALEDRTVYQDEKIAALETTQDLHAENQLIQLRLINDLRETTKKELEPLQRDRADILRALLAANGGKMLAKDARKKMHVSPATFSVLLSTIKDDIETKPYHLNTSWKVLVLK